MNTRTTPQSTRKPGIYIGFNTSLALSGLPANAQRLCLIVPITAKAPDAALPLQVTRIFSEDVAERTYGPIAGQMVQHALRTHRGANLYLLGLTVEAGKAPDIKPALDILLGVDMELVVSAWMDDASLKALRDHLNEATDSINQRSRLGIAAVNTTLAAATAASAKLNAGAISLAALPGSATPPEAIAAAYAAALAAEEDPARPMNTVELPSIAVPPIPSRLSRTEQENALTNGVTPLEMGPGGTIQIVRAISTYTKSPTGAADVALLDITTMRTLYYVRNACRDRLRLRFPRAKLSAATPTKVRSELLDVLKKCEEERVEILKNVDKHASALVVEPTGDGTGRLRATIPADVIEGLHVIDATIDLYL